MNISRRHFVLTTTLGGLASALVASTSRVLAADAAAAAGEARWRVMDFGKISVGGELAQRARQNWDRLHHPAYLVPRIFANETIEEWPGDWVGRTLLGVILLSRSTGRDVSDAAQIVQQMPKYLNKDGYFGQVIDPNALNEQQLGDSHAWVLRALYEYYSWTGDEKAREMFGSIVHNMAIPMRDWWASYPITLDVRAPRKGGVNGNLQWRSGRWLLSSDVGNEFMFLDGLTQAWQLDRSAELKEAVDRGIERFLKMDVLTVKAQTHATLTASRALLRMYGLIGDTNLLYAVERRYTLYRQVAMTENYENYNWFARPDTWTEPCAVIDSFIVAMQLWQFTGRQQYLEDAHLIWFNGVGRGQRATGGFGCNTCAGVGGPFLSMSFYEAYFCCTMRGGEGHSYAIQSAYHTRPGELAVTFYNDSTATLDLGKGSLQLVQSTRYPNDGTVRFKVAATTTTVPIVMRLFAPSWMKNPRLELNGTPADSHTDAGFLVVRFTPRAGDQLRLDSKLKVWSRPSMNPHSIRGYHVLHAGPLILGHLGPDEVSVPESAELVGDGHDSFHVRGADTILTRIDDINRLPQPSWDPLDPEPVDPKKRQQLAEKLLSDASESKRQVLFRDA